MFSIKKTTTINALENKYGDNKTVDIKFKN